MEKIEELLPAIEKVLTRLEGLLRGGLSRVTVTESNELQYQANTLYQGFYQLVLDSPEIPSNRKAVFLEQAVRLHNKSRNLNSSLLGETRTTLKATAAWMFTLFGEKTSRVLATVIKLLSKAGEEFSRLYHIEERASECFHAVCVLWKSAGDLPVYADLPPLELQEIKLAVFRSLLGKLAQATENPPLDIRTVKSDVAFMMELAPGLALRFKLLLVDTLQRIAHRCADTSDGVRDAISLLAQALDTLDACRQDDLSLDATMDGQNRVRGEFQDQIKELRVRTYLMMVFLFTETDELTKALASIREIEKLEQKNGGRLDTLSHTIAFAKLSVALREQSRDKADTYLKQLLKSPRTPFSTALSAVKKTVETCGENDRERVSELFRALANKFPEDPEFTAVRIAHLQSMIASSRADQAGAEDFGGGEKAREIAARVLADHKAGRHTLGETDRDLFRGMLTEAVRRHSSLGQWRSVDRWASLLAELCEGEPHLLRHYVGGLVARSEALLELGDLIGAASTADKVVAAEVSTKTLAALFRTQLYLDDCTADQAVKQVADAQARTLAASLESEKSGGCVVYSPEERMRQLLVCAYLAQQLPSLVSSKKKDEATLRLLRLWVSQFASAKAWRHRGSLLTADEAGEETDMMIDKENCGTEEQSESVLDVVSDYTVFFVQALRRDLGDLDFAVSSAAHLFGIQTSSIPVNDEKLSEMKEEISQTNQPHEIKDSSRSTADVDDFLTQPQAKSDTNNELGTESTDDMDIEASDSSPSKSPITSPIPNSQTPNIENPSAIVSPTVGDSLESQTDSVSEPKSSTTGFSVASIDSLVSSIQQQLLPVLLQLIGILDGTIRDKISVDVLGSRAGFEWLAQVCGSLGSFLLDAKDTYILGCQSGDKCSLDLQYRLLRVASLLFEYAERLISVHATGDSCHTKTRAKYLLTAAASLLDTIRADPVNVAATVNGQKNDNSEYSNNQDSSGDISLQALCNGHERTNPSNDITIVIAKKAEAFVAKAATLQAKTMDFADGEDRQLNGVALLLRVACFCAHGSLNESETFTTSIQGEVLLLPAADLRICIDLATASRRFSLEAFRNLLQAAIQAAVRSADTSTSTIDKNGSNTSVSDGVTVIGWLYRRLIEVSATRSQALEKVREFAQLLRDSRYARGVDRNDVDAVLALSYNFAVALVDLDQLGLAERFLSQSMVLLEYCSESTKQWIPRIQETFSYILSLRAEQTGQQTCQATGDTLQPDLEELTESAAVVGHISVETLRT